MKLKRSYEKRGQVAQEALMSIAIYTAFILVLLSALIHILPEIQQHQEKEKQRQINNYRCTTIDALATLQSTNISINVSDGDKLHCISSTEAIAGRKFRINLFEEKALD